jgi:hypothetical protein
VTLQALTSLLLLRREFHRKLDAAGTDAATVTAAGGSGSPA